jgi:hypothetical protein
MNKLRPDKARATATTHKASPSQVNPIEGHGGRHHPSPTSSRSPARSCRATGPAPATWSGGGVHGDKPELAGSHRGARHLSNSASLHVSCLRYLRLVSLMFKVRVISHHTLLQQLIGCVYQILLMIAFFIVHMNTRDSYNSISSNNCCKR